MSTAIHSIRDVPKNLVRRQPEEFRRTHEAADKIELRMARSFVRAVHRLRKRVLISELNVALALRDEKRALRHVSNDTIRDAFTPVGNIASDAVIQGGRIGAKLINEGS